MLLLILAAAMLLTAGCGVNTAGESSVSASTASADRETERQSLSSTLVTAADLEDGSYTIGVTLEGGSGRAGVDSPAALRVSSGAAYATIIWSSPNYDYMRLGEETFLPVNTQGNSTFEIPVAAFNCPITVWADTTAMSVPHEIEYTLSFDASTLVTAG